MTPESQTRLMLVDDHEIMRDGLREVLEHSGEFRVVGEAGDGDVRPIRTVTTTIRRKLGDDADNPTYIFTELRVGYKMPRADAPK